MEHQSSCDVSGIIHLTDAAQSVRLIEPDIMEQLTFEMMQLSIEIFYSRKLKRDLLHFAIMEFGEYGKQEKFIQFLIKRGADVNKRNTNGASPLRLAAEGRDNGIVRMLLDAGADPNSRKGEVSGLHSAVKIGGIGIVRMLLDAGADPNSRNDCIYIQSPLHLAVTRGEIGIIKMLLNSGADPKIEDNYRLSPLHLAAERGGIQIVRMLLDAGADPNSKDLVYKQSPLHLAVRKGEIKIMRMLLDAGADSNSKEGFQMSLLHLVCSEGDKLANRELIVQQLIENGASVNARGNSWVQPLHLASKNTNADIVRMLLRAGADHDSRDQCRYTSLHWAAYHENRIHVLPIVDCLIRNGADPRAHSKDPRPAYVAHFERASDDELEQIMEMFLKHTPDLFSTKLPGRKNSQFPWFFQFETNECSQLKFKYICEKIIDDSNNFGRNLWHNSGFLYAKNEYDIDSIIRSISLFSEMAKCCATETAMNSKDIFGYTPGLYVVFYNRIVLNVFETDSDISTISNFSNFTKRLPEITEAQTNLLRVYVYAGLNPAETDNYEASLVHHVAASAMSDALDFLLKQCGDECLNGQDKDGSTPLHYAASVGRKQSCEILLKHGCEKSIKDNNGRTACDLAMLFSYEDVIVLLRENTESSVSHIFRCRNEEYEYDLIKDDEEEEEEENVLQSCLKSMCGHKNFDDTYRSLLTSPAFGSRYYQDVCIKTEDGCFKNEIQIVYEGVMSIIGKIKDRMSLQCPLFAFDVKLRGSASEGTKIGRPDEFDVMLKMNNLSEYCQAEKVEFMDRVGQGPLGDHIVRLTSTIDAMKSMKTDSQYVIQGKMYKEVNAALRAVVVNSEVWDHCSFMFVDLTEMRVGMALQVLYNGPLYKALLISIDLVPCVHLEMDLGDDIEFPDYLKYWSRRVDLTDCQLYVMLENKMIPFFGISFTDYEELIMKSLPKSAIDAYVITKALRSPRLYALCTIVLSESKSEIRYDELVSRSSYKLKKGLFKTAEQFLHSAQHDDMNSVQLWIHGILRNCRDV